MGSGYAVGSTKQLKPLKISDVANSAVDLNATYVMVEKSDKSLMDNFLQMGTKGGG